MAKKLTTEEFIEKAKEIHGDKDTFEKTVYTKSLEKTIITCKVHGDYEISPNNYLSGHRCPHCSKFRHRYTTEEYVKKANEIHNGKYRYEKTKYINQDTKICITCPEHGDFWQLPTNHLQGKGCPHCSKRHVYTTSEIVEEFKKVHGDKYDYSKVEYNGIDNKVCIVCPEHGEFWQSPWNHIHNKQDCPKCSHRSYKFTTEEWVEKAKQNPLNKNIDFSKVEYVNNKTKVKIICPKHGEVMASPIYTVNVGGCPLCKTSKLEEKLSRILERNNIVFERQKRIWENDKQSLDFYLPEQRIAIECQGQQHFYPVDFAGKGEKWAKERFDETVTLDKMKKEKCERDKIKLLYYSNKEYVDNIITDEKALIREIIKQV